MSASTDILSVHVTFTVWIFDLLDLKTFLLLLVFIVAIISLFSRLLLLLYVR